MVMECMFIRMEPSMKVIGLMIYNMERERRFGRIHPSTKVIYIKPYYLIIRRVL
jgi:hypothetical protein